jgi:hypothetical protein
MSYPQIHKGSRSGAAFTRSPSGVFDFAGTPTPGVVLSRYLSADEIAQLIWFDNEVAEIDDFEISDDSADCWHSLRYIRTAPRSHFIYGHSNSITLDFAGIALETGQSPQEFGDDDEYHLMYPFPWYGFGQDSAPGGGAAIEPPADDTAPKSVFGDFGCYANTTISAYNCSYVQEEIEIDGNPAGGVEQKYEAHASGFVTGLGNSGDTLGRSALPEFNEYWYIYTTSGPYLVTGFGGDSTHAINPICCEYDPDQNRLYVSWRSDYYDAGDYTPPGVRPPLKVSDSYTFGYLKGPDESHDNFWGYTMIYSHGSNYVESLVARRGEGGVFAMLVTGANTRQILYSDGGSYASIKSFSKLGGNAVVRWSEELQKVFFSTRELNDDETPVVRSRVKTIDPDGGNEAVWLEFDGTIYGMEVIG